MKAIFLIGFMGSGKTTFGKILAEALHIPFYDLDVHIEATTGMSISKLFDSWGESRFREYEAQALRAFDSQRGPFVLASGGGTPCFYESMQWMNQQGQTLFLDIPFDEISKRLTGTEALRPVLKQRTKEKMEENLYELYIQRRETYLQAASILGPESPNVNEVIHILNS